jgi:hypothetical protein
MLGRGHGVKKAATRADVIKLFPATACSVWQDALYLCIRVEYMFPRCRTEIVSKHNRRYAGLSVCCDPFQIGELASLKRLSDSHHLTPVGYAHARSGEPIASGPLCQLETRVPQTLTRSSYAQVTRSRCHLQSLWCCYYRGWEP